MAVTQVFASGIAQGKRNCKVMDAKKVVKLMRARYEEPDSKTLKAAKRGAKALYCDPAMYVQCEEALYSRPQKKGKKGSWECTVTSHPCGPSPAVPCRGVAPDRLFTIAERTPGAPRRVRADAAGNPIWEAPSESEVASPTSSSFGGVSRTTLVLAGVGILAALLFLRR